MAQTFWIARDKDGELTLFREIPERGKLVENDEEESIFVTDSDFWILDPKDFPEVTWENSPVEVELKLK